MKKLRPNSQFKEYFLDHLKVLEKIKEAGFKAYFIGGAVRDALLSIKPYDFDIATNAPLESLKEIFPDTFDLGLSFGTISVKYEGHIYQITRFRKEYKYVNNRKPERVTFSSSLYQDLKRRDFTINTLAYDGSFVIGYFKAFKHLDLSIIKAVGRPNKRIREDVLRILRGLRFSLTLNFSIEKNTFKAMRKNVYLLKNISKERILEELLELLKKVDDISLLKELGIFDQVFINSSKINSTLRKSDSIFIKLASLFENLDLEKELTDELDNLKMSNKMKDHIFSILSNKDIEISDKSLRFLLSKYDLDCVYSILEYSNSEELGLLLLKQILEIGYLKSPNDLKISGHDLMALGYNKEEIGNIKRKLFDMVIYEPSKNQKDYLIAMVKDEFNK